MAGRPTAAGKSITRAAIVSAMIIAPLLLLATPSASAVSGIDAYGTCQMWREAGNSGAYLMNGAALGFYRSQGGFGTTVTAVAFDTGNVDNGGDGWTGHMTVALAPSIDYTFANAYATVNFDFNGALTGNNAYNSWVVDWSAHSVSAATRYGFAISITNVVWGGASTPILSQADHQFMLVKTNNVPSHMNAENLQQCVGVTKGSELYAGTSLFNSNVWGGALQNGPYANGGATVLLTNAAPATAPSISATVHDASSIDVAWASVPGATGYSVFLSSGSTSTAIPMNASGYSYQAHVDAPGLRVTGLLAGTTYHVRVVATNAFGEGAISNDASARTPAPPGAPRSLTLARGPSGHETSLSWSAPSTSGDSGITGYHVYRGIDGGPLTLAATVAGLTFAEGGLGCSQSVQYDVAAVSASGEGPHATAAGGPDPQLQLLCLLEGQPEFYWGPVAYDNSAGAPYAPPSTMTEVTQRASAGQVPEYFQSPPYRVTFGTQIGLDANTLVQESGVREFSFAPLDAVARFAPGCLATALDLMDRSFDATVDVHGFRYQGAPTPVAPYAAAIPAVFDLNFSVGGFGHDSVTPGALAGGYLYADNAGGLHLSPLARNDAFLVVQGPNFAADCTLATPGSIDLWGFDVPLPHVDSGIDITGSTSASGGIGELTQPGTITPRLVTAGIGGDAVGSTTVHSLTDAVVGALRWDMSGGSGVHMLVEGLLPTTSIDETYTSGYSGVTYRSIQQPAATFIFRIDPTSVGGSACQRLLWGEHCGGASASLPSLPPIIWTMGAATLRSSTFAIQNPASIFGATPHAASTSASAALDVPAAAQDIVIDAAGAPGQTGDITIERPVAFFDASGAASVDTWTLTLPNLTLDASGHAQLHIDTASIQRAIQEATAHGLTFADAVVAANAEVDANGDGIPDLEQPFIPATTLSPVSIVIHAPDSLELGGANAIAVNVTSAQGASIGASGIVDLAAGGALLASAPVETDGSARFTLPLPASLPQGPLAIEARYHGADGYGNGSARIVRDAADRAPAVSFALPPFAPIAPDANGTVSIGFLAPGADDLDVATAALRVDDGPWIDVPSLRWTTNATELGIPQGFHTLSARVSDRAGNFALKSTAFAFDTGAPHVNMSVEAPLQLASAVNVTWSADEPVLAQLNITQVGGATWSVASTDFAASGGFPLSLAPGAYLLTMRVMDTAANAANANDGAPAPLVIGPAAPTAP